MPANAVVQSPAVSWDEMAVVLRPYITQDGTLKGGPHWSAEKIEWSIGADPSSCTCKIPLRDLDDIAPAVGAVANSPAAGMRLLASGQVKLAMGSGDGSGNTVYNDIATVFRGLVTKIGHEFGPKSDFAFVRLEDARWLLKRTPIIGRWEIQDDPSLGRYPTYRQGWPCHPNEGGEPNAIYSNDYGCFVFCSPRVGLSADEVPPNWQAGNPNKATWWTDYTLIEYLRMALTTYPSKTGSTAPQYSILPDGIVWPVGLPSPLKTLDIGHAHAKDMSYDGMNVADALSQICKHAGAYDITMLPYAEQPTLAIIETKYGYATAGVTLNRPDSSNNIAGAKIIIGGELSEDADEFYSKVTVAGALTFVERRIDSTSSGLMPAWSAATSGSGLAYFNTKLASGASFDQAKRLTFAAFPDWLGAWKLNPQYDFRVGVDALTGTSQATVNRPILDRLLTSYVEGTGNSDLSDRSQWRRPVWFEFKHTGADSYVVTSIGDGLQIDAQGTIRMYGLREAQTGNSYSTEAFYCDTSGTGTDMRITSITGSLLRVTVAIPCDHRITASFKHPSNPDACAVPEQTFDAERVESGVTGGHAYLLGAHDDVFSTFGAGTFRQEYRSSGWPIPESVTGTNAYTPEVIWQDTGNISGSAKRMSYKMSRIRRGGSLIVPRLSASFSLGQAVAALSYSGGAYPIKSVITKITWNNTPGTQRTVLDFSA